MCKSKFYFFAIIKCMKRHVIWIIEVLIWLLILASVSSIFIITKYNEKKMHTYQIFLPDVDGLIKGSPVKYMGIQIGYVNQVNIVEDKVFLNFVVTEKNIKLPHGVIATVEFLGLGGSKSLELYPPLKGETSKKLIVEQPPKRIGDSLDLLYKMFMQIGEITYSISHFMGELEVIKPQAEQIEKNNYKFAEKLFDVTNSWFDNSQKRVDNLNKKIK